MEVLFDLESIKENIKKLEDKSLQEEFWKDQEEAQKILKNKKNLENTVAEYEKISEGIEDIYIFIEMATLEEDLELVKQIEKDFSACVEKIEELRLKVLLTGEYDSCNAILSIQAGAGGKDAQDWAEILFRQYSRWSEKKGFKSKTLYYQDDTEGGIKNVTILIQGENAYGYLKAEKGVHRLVRISPFDSSGKRHTSFAAIDVMPEIEENENLEIDPEDLRIDTFRAGGAGGQHVNKTDSAVRITHIPTNIIVSCQNERSQLQNKEIAMKILMSKLIEIKKEEHKETLKEIKGDYGQIAWGSQIRSYVFHPYSMVKDHRTGEEIGNVEKVLDGDIDMFISAKLKMDIEKENQGKKI